MPDFSLEDLLKRMELTPQDRAQANAMGLLSMGLGLMGARRGQEFQQFGRAGLLGLGARTNQLEEMQQNKLRGIAAQRTAMETANMYDAYKQQQAERALTQQYMQPGMPQMGPPTAQGEMQPAVAPNLDLQGYAKGLTAINPQKGMAMQQALAKPLKELKDTRTLTKDGKRVTVNFYKDGSYEIVPFAPDQEKAHFADIGSGIVPTDPFTGKPIGSVLPKMTTPDAELSAKISMRGQNMTDARSREQNAIALGNKEIQQIDAIRKQLNQLPDVQNYRAAAPMVRSAAKAPDTSAGDLDIIYAVGKALDPNSVVREGELNLVIKSGSLPQKIEGMANYVMGGGRLSPSQRADLLNMLGNRVGQLKQAHDAAMVPFKKQADANALPWDQIAVNPPDYRGDTGGPISSGKKVVRTGVEQGTGRKVVQYEDGTIGYQ